MVQESVVQQIEALKGEFSTCIDSTTTADKTYIGKAKPGSSESAGSWQIKVVDETTNVKILWANGDTLFNKVWDDRASYNYS